jgi:hypothetical protein
MTTKTYNTVRFCCDEVYVPLIRRGMLSASSISLPRFSGTFSLRELVLEMEKHE